MRRTMVMRPEVTDLAGAIYEAAAEPELWQAALDRLGDALGGAALVNSYHRRGAMAFGVSNRLDPEAENVLRTHYATAEKNPLFAAMPQLGVLQPVARESLMDDESYFQSGLFNEVFRAQGFVHAGLSCLARENGTLVASGLLCRRNQEFDTGSFQLYGAILPRLRRALELTVRYSDLRAAHHHVEAVANAGEDGYIVTDATARVLYSNARADRVLSAADGLSCRGNILAAARQEETSQLHRLISSASLRLDRLGGNMRISRVEAVMPWAVVVVPAPEAFAGNAAEGKNSRNATTLVRLIDLERKAAVPAARLIAFFGFSKTEAMIAIDLIEGLRPDEIAERRNVRITTIRTHIRSIYLKAGTSRQAELVRLLLRTAGSFAQSDFKSR